jgi:TRAP-type C4-dicarboxylate transport system substrate-binding protein
MTTTIARRSALVAVGALGAAGLGRGRAVRAADAPIELRCSIETPPRHARNIFTRQYLDMVREASGRRIAPHLFESGSLFADRDVPKAITQGQIEMALPLTFLMSGFVRDANVFELPICYGREPAEVMKLVRGPVGQEIANQLAQRLHVHVLGEWLPDGFQNFFGTRKPLNSYADLKGLKVRSPGGVLHGPELLAQSPQSRPGSGDAHRDRASQLQHAVERIDADVHLGRPALVLA